MGIKQIKTGKMNFYVSPLIFALKRLEYSFFSFLLLSLSAGLSSAQALEFKSYVDKTEAALNEALTLSLEFQSSEEPPNRLNISAPAVYNLKDFLFLNEAQSQKSSLSIINGKRELVLSLIKSFRLQPKALGAFTIAPMRVTAGNRVFQTSAFEIKVSADKKPGPAPQRQSPFSFPGFSNPLSFPPSLFDFPDPFKPAEGDFKLVLDLSKKKLYKTEPLRADWLLLASSKIPRYEMGPILPPKGFWKEEFKNAKGSAGARAIGDTLYRKQLAARLWLFPLKTGELKVPSHSIQAFSGFSFQSQILSSPEKTVQVKELPLRGRDLSWTGAVGAFQVDFSLPKRDLILNEPFSFKITFKGSGHPRFIQLPYLTLPSYFQIYEPVQKSNFSPEGEGVKEFEILIVPKKEGSLVFPSITLSSFDPKTEEYIHHKSPELKLLVKKDPNASANRRFQIFFETPLQKEDSAGADFSKFYWPNFLSYKTALLSFKAFFFILFVIFLIVAKRKIFSNKKHSYHKKLKSKIKKIETSLNKSGSQKKATDKTRQENLEMACIEMIDLLMFVLDRFQPSAGSSHWREALEKLPPSLNKKYSPDLERLFKELEQLSFSSQKDEKKAYKKSQALFKKIKLLSQDLSLH